GPAAHREAAARRRSPTDDDAAPRRAVGLAARSGEARAAGHGGHPGRRAAPLPRARETTEGRTVRRRGPAMLVVAAAPRVGGGAVCRLRDCSAPRARPR